MKRQLSTHPNQPVKIHKDGKNEVTYRHILTLSDKEVSEGNETNHIMLRVGQWSSNQSCGGKVLVSPITIEKRRVHICKTGRISHRQMMGLTLEDLKVISDNWESILQALQQD